MKKLLVFLSLLLSFSFFGVAQASENNKVLVAYFSRTGNTEQIAKNIAELSGGQVFKIETTQAYPKEYRETLKIAQEEFDQKSRPKLAGSVPNMNDYQFVFVGFPNWIGTMPMAVFTFLESYDFTNKTIIPFCTSGGSGFANSLKDMQALVPNAKILQGLDIKSADLTNSKVIIQNWLNELEIIK